MIGKEGEGGRERKRERERGGERERERNVSFSVLEAGWRRDRRETGDIGGRKCGMVKGWVLEHCITATQSPPAF